MNPTFKRYLLSSTTTFLTSFFGALAIQLSNGMPVQISSTFFFGLVSVAVRAGVKALVESSAGTHADLEPVA